MTIRENLQVTYWQIAYPSASALFGNTVSSYLFGKKGCDLKKLTTLLDLQFYLDIMEQQKELDISNALIEDTAYYKTLFCIDSIKKQLRCTGIDNIPNLVGTYLTISKLIDVYTEPDITGQGIGYMSIEGTTNPFHIANN